MAHRCRRVVTAGKHGRAFMPFKRLREIAGAVPVIGKQGSLFIQRGVVAVFECACDRGMDLATAHLELAIVGDLLG